MADSIDELREIQNIWKAHMSGEKPLSDQEINELVVRKLLLRPPPKAQLVKRLLELSGSQRLEITRRLNLLGEGDVGLPEQEQCGRAIGRAASLGVLDDVASAIAHAGQEPFQEADEGP